MPRTISIVPHESFFDEGQPAWEKNDCTVRALSKACNLPYLEAHGLLKMHGRKNRKGTRAPPIVTGKRSKWYEA